MIYRQGARKKVKMILGKLKIIPKKFKCKFARLK